jgi:hypothetical protein
MSVDRRQFLQSQTAAVAAVMLGGSDVAAQAGQTALVLRIKGGCVYAFNKGDGSVNLVFPTAGHKIYFGVVSGRVTDHHVSWSQNPRSFQLQKEKKMWFAGASGTVGAESYGQPVGDKAPGETSTAWAKFGYVPDFARQFGLQPNLSIGKDVVSATLRGGHLRASVPSDPVACDAVWKLELKDSNKSVHQAITDTTSWVNSVQGRVKVCFGAEPFECNDWVEIESERPNWPVELSLEGLGGGEMSKELTHYAHLFALVGLGNALKNPVLGPRADGKDRTPGRFCPGLQVEI